MALTYEPLATATTSSGAISFSSISGAYTDLRVVLNVQTTSANQNLRIRFNSDTATNYSWIMFRTNAGASGTTVNGIYSATTAVNIAESMYTIDIMSYAGSNFKTALVVGNAGMHIGQWRSTAAITAIELAPSTGTWTGAATLYGILKA